VASALLLGKGKGFLAIELEDIVAVLLQLELI
jgi:hypothetical protein